MTARLKNYTTTIPSSRSIGEIQTLLIEFGAQNIILDAENKRVTAVKFVYRCRDMLIPFKLPVNIESTVDVLWNDYRKSTSRGRKERHDFYDEAERIAWRIVRDWIHAQLSILAIEATGFLDVFAGYLVTDMRTGETVGEKLSSGKLKNLIPERLHEE